MTWDISATLARVEHHFGKPQRQIAEASINSVNQRVRYAVFHYRSIDAELVAFKDRLGDRNLLEVHAGSDEEETEYYAFMDRVGAHAVACVQSIHALEDLLAATVYRCLNLDRFGKALDEHQLSLRETTTRLQTQPPYAKVQSQLESLKPNPHFAHIDALSNKAKHSTIVRPWISQNTDSTRPDPLLFYFEAFTRRTDTFAQVPFNDLLEPALRFAGNTRVDIGIELTALLK
ncbi:hypothetical protein LXT12_26485 [Pelomonas sp. P7]|uniref:Cthe-2314-like HEPN domain-containing protein n=1 Tax=Pelomonas caseinilytica TaxID=2906763 RepID=A0ABS8XIU6_9BURK|nr:hypothetical protein [Pelomonas sp. P7]MCE4540782.1 hypothetical protein [Pelomonas sp. P7]